jgi:NitT/TauT family transport system permease protein
MSRGLDALVKYLPFVVVVAAWEMGVRAGFLNPAFFSSPAGVLDGALHWYGTGKILPHLARTLGEILAGTTISFLVGVPTGILIGWYRRFADGTNPVLSFLDAVPAVAVAPMGPLVLGLGPWTAIILVVYLTIFPTVFNVAAGVRTVAHDLLRMGRHFGASDRQLFATIVLPSIVPYVIGVLRGTIGRALAGALVGEWLGSNAGLGSMMFDAAAIFEAKTVYVSALTVVALSLVASAMVAVAERRLWHWRPV